MIFQPEGGVNQRVVLRHRTHFEPDALQSTQIVQSRILRYIIIVIPDESAAQRREIGQEDKENDQAALPDRQHSPTNEHWPGKGLL